MNNYRCQISLSIMYLFTFSNCPDTGMSLGGGPPMLPLTVLLSFWSSESLQGLPAARTTLSFQSPTTTSSATYPKFVLVPPPAPAEFPGRGCLLVGRGGGRGCTCGCVWFVITSSCSKELPLRRVLSWSRKQLVAGVERRGLVANSLAARQCLSWYVRPDMRLLTEPMAVPELQGPQGTEQGPEGEWDGSGRHCWTSRPGLGWSVTDTGSAWTRAMAPRWCRTHHTLWGERRQEKTYFRYRCPLHVLLKSFTHLYSSFMRHDPIIYWCHHIYFTATWLPKNFK